MTNVDLEPATASKRIQAQRHWKRAIAFLSLCLIAFCCSVPAKADELHRLRSQAYRNAAKRIAPSVVQIETFGGLERVGRLLVGTGPTTGLVVSEDGLIVSSAFNFIQKPSSTLVTLANEKRYPAKIVARDGSRMLVLLKIEPDEPLTVAQPVPSDELRIGQTSIAVGRTYNRSSVNMSAGIISAVDRIWGRAIQTDANVSPANYGGPLIDLRGRVFGVLAPLSPNSSQEVAGTEWYDSGIGFAIPLADIQRQLETWRQGEDLMPGKMGVSFADAGALDSPPKIAVVKLKSPAAEAGLKAGDIVSAFDGHPVRRLADLRHKLGPHYAGDEVELRLQRDGETVTAKLTLVAKIPPYEHAFLGILPAGKQEDGGVHVRYVYPDSPADNAGIQAGDVITSLDDNTIVDADELRSKLANQSPGDVFQLSWTTDGDGSKQTAEIALEPLPVDLPGELPARAETDSEQAEEESGETEIKIPEEPNKCSAYIPKDLARSGQPSLLVVINPPGDDTKKTFETWQEICDAHNIVLLVPEPQDPKRWQPTELGFINKAIDQAIDRFNVSEQRIAVMGRESGGRLAYVLAFRNREKIRGLIVTDAVGSRGGQPIAIENEPLQRLAIALLINEETDSAREMKKDAEALREQKFPVTVLELALKIPTKRQNEGLARWLDALDRI